jgi:hypothetical protein
MSLKDGSTYTGLYNKENRNGQGSWISADKTLEEGIWERGELKIRNGQASYTYKNGESYIGQWTSNKKSGYGTFIWPDGKKYIGNWVNNKFDGQGTFIFPESAKYTIMLVDAEYFGEGISSMSFGTYVGKFKNGKYNGRGVLTLPDGRVLRGNFVNNFLK